MSVVCSGNRGRPGGRRGCPRTLAGPAVARLPRDCVLRAGQPSRHSEQCGDMIRVSFCEGFPWVLSEGWNGGPGVAGGRLGAGVKCGWAREIRSWN